MSPKQTRTLKRMLRDLRKAEGNEIQFEIKLTALLSYLAGVVEAVIKKP